MNPADAFLDIISGTILPASGQALDVAAAWQLQQSGGGRTFGRSGQAGSGDAAAAIVGIAPSWRATQEAAMQQPRAKLKVGRVRVRCWPTTAAAPSG
jgi:hypothetical protein